MPIITYNLLSIERTTIFDIESETKKQNNLTQKRVTMKNYSLYNDYHWLLLFDNGIW